MSDRPEVTIDIQLRFGDTDKLGHINNAAFASFAEVGRLALLKSLGLETASLILARLAIDFRQQVRLSDACAVTTRVESVKNSSVVLSQTLTANGVVAAEFEAVVVWFDYHEQRPVRVPEAARAALLVGSRSSAR